MKCLIIMIFCVFNIVCFGQKTVYTSSEMGCIKQLCKENYKFFDSLNKNFSNSQVDSMLNCKNGILKVVGFLLFINRNNIKDSVLQELNRFLQEDYISVTMDCNKKNVTCSVGEYCYKLVFNDNTLFTPNFHLTRADQIRLNRDIDFYERKNSKEKNPTYFD